MLSGFMLYTLHNYKRHLSLNTLILNLTLILTLTLSLTATLSLTITLSPHLRAHSCLATMPMYVKGICTGVGAGVRGEHVCNAAV